MIISNQDRESLHLLHQEPHHDQQFEPLLTHQTYSYLGISGPSNHVNSIS